MQGGGFKVEHRLVCIVEVNSSFLPDLLCLLCQARGRLVCDIKGACGGVLQLSRRPGEHASTGPSSFEKMELKNIAMISRSFCLLVPVS